MLKKSSILKDALRKISLNKNKFISLLLLIIVGSGLYVGIKATPSAMKETATNYYKETNLFDLKITSSIGFTNSDKYTLKQIKGIEGISFVKTLDVLTNINNKDYVIKLNSINSNRDFKNEDYINRLVLTSGKYPSTINEGLVEEKFLQETNLKLGDLITLSPSNEEDLKAKKIKIVGTVKSSYYASNNKGLSSLGNGKIDYVMFIEENDFSSSTYNEGFITIKNIDKYNTYGSKYEKIINEYKEEIDKKITEISKSSYNINASSLNNEIASLKDELNELNQTDLPIESLGDMVKQITKQLETKENELSKLNNYNVYSSTRNDTPGFYEYKLEIERIENISNFFPSIFLLIVIIVSVIVIIRIIEEEKTQIGYLRTLGYKKITIMFKYILYAFLVSFIGSIIGSLLFNKILPLLIGISCNISYKMPIINANLQIKPILISILLSCLIITLLIMLYFVKIFSKLPAELMRPKFKNENKKRFLEKFCNKLSFLNKINLKNITKYKKNFSISILVICLSTLLIITFFGIKDSISTATNKQFNNINKYDITLNISKTASNNDSLISNIKVNKEIKELTKVSSLPINIKNKNIKESAYLIIPENKKEINKYITLKSITNNESINLNDKGVIISEKLALILNIKKGNEIELTLNNNKNIKVKVEEITKNYINHYIYMSPSLYEKLSNKEVDYNKILINTKKLNKNKEKELVNYLSEIEDINNVELTSNIKLNNKELVSSLNYAIDLLIIFVMILIFLILYNFFESTKEKHLKEITSLKVIGFYDKEIVKYIYKKMIINIIIGEIIGLILGCFLTYYIINNFETNKFIFNFKINFISFILSISIIFIFTLIINKMIYFKFKKTSIADILKKY